jgi:hypothetical protein
MYKLLVTLYLVVFFTYILFSGQPDYFDGEFTPATIHLTKDSVTHKIQAVAEFTVGAQHYSVNAMYPLRDLREGKKVTVIYELSHPQKGAVYAFWGYWITIGELIASVVLLFALFQIAVGIIKNPTPEALMDDMNHKPEKKRRYDD